MPLQSMDHHLVSWRTAPELRGTSNILFSCLGTLSICVWSALHLDIQQRKSTRAQFLTKCGWVVIGLLCPELLLFAAFCQWVVAMQLTVYGQTRLRVARNGDSDVNRLSSRLMRALVRLFSGQQVSTLTMLHDKLAYIAVEALFLARRITRPCCH